MIYGVILCIGDSLITGARDEAGLSVPMLLGDALSKDGQRWLAIDEGANGETTGSLLKRFYKTVRAYPEAKDVVLCVGINDAKTPILAPEHFQRNYAELIKTLTILKKHVFACAIPAQAGFGAPDYIDNEAVVAYNGIIHGFEDQNVTIVDLTKVPKRCRADGVHFNLEGDKWTATCIASSIRTARS